MADPVGSGAVASLARPGGNITGLSNQSAETAGKRLELLREIIPDLRRLGIIANAINPDAASEARQTEEAARALGFEVTMPEIRRAEDVIPAFAMFKGHTQALMSAPIRL
jgi:putative tryptophan/tyrosine transport system substrate-binding protein